MTAPGLFAPVVARLEAGAEAHFGSPESRVVPVAYEERPFSHLLLATVRPRTGAAPSCSIYIKVFKTRPAMDVDMMRRRVAHDFATTRHVHRALARWEHFAVVRPIAWFANELAIVTERAPGTTLLRHLHAHAAWLPGAASRAALERTLAAVGRWIPAFQAADDRPGLIDAGALRDYVDVRLTRLVAGGAMSAAEQQRLRRHLDRLCARVPRADLRETIIHADLAPGNVLIAGPRVTVLDLAMAGRGSALHDVTRLYMQLSLLRAKPQFRSTVVAALQASLLAGFDPACTPERPLFRLLLLLHRINHLGTLSLSREPFPARVFSRRICQLHRRWIAQELQCGEERPAA